MYILNSPKTNYKVSTNKIRVKGEQTHINKIRNEATCSNYLSIYVPTVLQPFVGSWPIFSFLISFTQSVGLLGRGISTSQSSCLHTHTHTHTHSRAQTQNKRTQTFMSQVGFESTIPAFQRAKTVHALDFVATRQQYIFSKLNHANHCEVRNIYMHLFVFNTINIVIIKNVPL
jgi:hypothetical protein